MSNLKLWDSVCVTDPAMTKKANVGGNKITSIKPQYQIKMATEAFGPYGTTWGFSDIEYNYSLEHYGLVVFKATFFFPEGEFVISNSIKIWKDNAKTKLDDDFAKKCETDALTKALSKLGFNADIFMGYFDDMRYVEQAASMTAQKSAPKQAVDNSKLIGGIKKIEASLLGIKDYTYMVKPDEYFEGKTYDELVVVGKELKEILNTLKGVE
tara:strand:- start:3190 stop:3822 length:633 start_codon:yes stop_codon:yes gene_type:complete